MGLSGERETDARFCCRGRRSGGSTKWRPCRSENQLGEDDVQDPWTLPPSRKRTERPIPGLFPVQVQVVRANLLYIENKDLPSAMLNRLLRLGAFQNPEFYKAQAMRLPTFNKRRVIACGEELARPHCPTTWLSGGGHRAIEIAPHQAHG